MKSLPFLFIVTPMLLLCAGCVVVNGAKPETLTKTTAIVETASAPSSSAVVDVAPSLEKKENALVLVLNTTIRDEYAKTRHEETVTVRKEKKIAIGLFPGATMSFLHPDDALRVAPRRFGSGDSPRYYSTYADETAYADKTGDYLLGQLVITPLTLGINCLIGTLDNLFVEPFRGWSPEVDYYDPYRWNATSRTYHFKIRDAHNSPKIKALLNLTDAERHGMGLWTCYDRHVPSKTGRLGIFGLVGCYKYPKFFVDVKRSFPQPDGFESKTRRSHVPGPYEATVEIPELGYRETLNVKSTETRAAFRLPKPPQDCTVRAYASFRESPVASASGSGQNVVTRQALAKTLGRRYSFDIALNGPPRKPKPQQQEKHPSAPTPRQQEQPFEVETIQPKGDGRYFVRVAVKDQSKTFSVLHSIKPEVSRLVREDFQSGNPSVPLQYIRENMRYETEKGGKFLTFTGWAFSVRPVEDGWQYDHESRRGWVRLRIGGGMPAEEAKRWARENIAAIVSEKNVALESGKAPPSGATFRSLGESFEGGVLTVEFEAAE